MQRLEISGVVRPIYGSLGVKRLTGELERMWKEEVLAVFKVKFTIPEFAWRNKDNGD